MNQQQHNTLCSHRIEECDYCKEHQTKYGWLFNFSITHRTKEKHFNGLWQKKDETNLEYAQRLCREIKSERN